MAPVVLLVLLPFVLGLDRYVITDSSMDGSMGRGSVVLAREVPPTDLRVGDVISFTPPGQPGADRVTRRIVAIDHGVATTQGDATGRPDPWSLPLTASAYPRTWVEPALDRLPVRGRRRLGPAPPLRRCGGRPGRRGRAYLGPEGGPRGPSGAARRLTLC